MILYLNFGDFSSNINEVLSSNVNEAIRTNFRLSIFFYEEIKKKVHKQICT